MFDVHDTHWHLFPPSSAMGTTSDGDRPWESYHTVYTNAKAGIPEIEIFSAFRSPNPSAEKPIDIDA